VADAAEKLLEKQEFGGCWLLSLLQKNSIFL